MIETKKHEGQDSETAKRVVDTKGFLLVCDPASLSFDAGEKLRTQHIVNEHFAKRYGEHDPQVREYFPDGLDLTLGSIFERNFMWGPRMVGANFDFDHLGFKEEFASASLQSTKSHPEAEEIRLKILDRYVREAFNDLRDLGLLYPQEPMTWYRRLTECNFWPEFKGVYGQITDAGRAALCEWREQRQHDSIVAHQKPRPDAA